MNSPLKELEHFQIRQIEDGFYQNDTEQIKEILNSIKILAFQNIYNKINQQNIKVEEETITPIKNDQIAEFYRNQYKSIDVVERSNIQSRMIKRRLQEYQTRNSPKNHRKCLPILNMPQNYMNSISFGKHYTPQSDQCKITIEKDRLSSLNKTMQQTLNTFTNKWQKKNSQEPSQTCRNNGSQRISKDSLNFTFLAEKTSKIFEPCTSKKRLASHMQKCQGPSPMANYKDEQLINSQIKLGNISFRIPKVNKFLQNEEFRVLRSRIERRKRPNFLIVDQKYNKE